MKLKLYKDSHAIGYYYERPSTALNFQRYEKYCEFKYPREKIYFI